MKSGKKWIKNICLFRAFLIIAFISSPLSHVAAAPFTIIFGDATKNAIETVALTIEDLEPTIFSVNFDVSAGMSGQDKALAFANKLQDPNLQDKFTATVLGASVTVNTRDDVPETLVKVEAIDNGGEHHFVSTPAQLGATGTITFIDPLSCVDSLGNPSTYHGGFFSPSLGGSSSPLFDCNDVMMFTGSSTVTGADVAQTIDAFFSMLLGPDQHQVVGNEISIFYPPSDFGNHGIDAVTNDSTGSAPLGLEIWR
jgi:hypothetical protein